jgi:hypothetical protein
MALVLQEKAHPVACKPYFIVNSFCVLLLWFFSQFHPTGDDEYKEASYFKVKVLRAPHLCTQFCCGGHQRVYAKCANDIHESN